MSTNPSRPIPKAVIVLGSGVLGTAGSLGDGTDGSSFAVFVVADCGFPSSLIPNIVPNAPAKASDVESPASLDEPPWDLSPARKARSFSAVLSDDKSHPHTGATHAFRQLFQSTWLSSGALVANGLAVSSTSSIVHLACS